MTSRSWTVAQAIAALDMTETQSFTLEGRWLFETLHGRQLRSISGFERCGDGKQALGGGRPTDKAK